MVSGKIRECPKCGLKQGGTKKVCAKCGLVFSRIQPPTKIEGRPSSKDKYQGFEAEPFDSSLIEEKSTMPASQEKRSESQTYRSRIYRFLSWMFLFVSIAYVGLVYVVGHPVEKEPVPVKSQVDQSASKVPGEDTQNLGKAFPLSPAEKALSVARAHWLGPLAFGLWAFFSLMAVLERIHESLRRSGPG